MAAHLTDKQKKEIIADYVEMGSYYAVAKKHKTTADTVKRWVLKDEETFKKTKDKKEENTADILAHMEAKKEVVNQIIDKYLLALLDEEKIKKATPSQLTTALGTLIDKFTVARAKAEENNIEDDNLIKALEGNAETLFDDGDDSDMLPEEEE